MKKIFIGIFLFSFLSTASFAQENVSFTVRPVPGQNNKAKLFMRSNQAISGVVTAVIFTFTLPATLMPQPTATFTGTGTLSYITYGTPDPATTIQEVGGTNFHVYTFFSAPTNVTVQNFEVNTEVEIGELTINSQTDATSEVRLVYLPDGGSNALSGYQFEVNGTDRINVASLFYGPGSTNAGSTSGFSFVPTSIVLPVNFKSFYAVKSGDDAKLTWDVSNGEKNDYFNVLRSADGRNFKTVQTVKAVGNGQSDNNYQTTDINLSKLGSREVYYQIQQFDKDGQNTKSPVRMLSVDGLGKSVTAFPNPAKTTTKVVVDAPEAGKGTLIMRDAAGRQVKVVNAQFFKGINQVEMNVMNLASGDYNIQVNGGGVNETIKVTKIN